jgi:hypothetical protein
MANRSYLYTANADFSKLCDVSETRSEIPLVYKILLSVNPRVKTSEIWDNPNPIAIYGDFEGGLANYLGLLDYLIGLGQHTEAFGKYKQDTLDFFEKESQRRQAKFFMEPGEVYDLEGISDMASENDQQRYRISLIGQALTDLLADRPTDLSGDSCPSWLKYALEQPAELQPYWTHVTYFSFNKQ